MPDRIQDIQQDLHTAISRVVRRHIKREFRDFLSGEPESLIGFYVHTQMVEEELYEDEDFIKAVQKYITYEVNMMEDSITTEILNEG